MALSKEQFSALRAKGLSTEQIVKFESQNKVAQPEQQKQDYGTITKTPSLIEKVIGRLSSKKTRPTGLLGGAGVISSAMGIPEENFLPVIGQGVGGLASGFPGAGTAGAMVGSGVGEAGKEAFKGAVRGETPDYSNIPMNMGITGLIEGLTRGAGNMFFKKQLAGKELGELGKKLGGMKAELAKSDAFIPSQQVTSNLESAYNSLPDPVKGGKAGKALRDWIKYGKTTPYFSTKDMILMEEHLGNVAEYGAVKKGFFQPATDIPNPALNTLAKTGRKQASDIVEQLSEKSGQKGFGETSKKISKILQRWPELDPSKSYGSFGSRMVTSSMAGMATGNPLVGAGTYLAEKTIQSPEFRNQAFKVVQHPVSRTVGTGSKLTLSELARKRKK